MGKQITGMLFPGYGSQYVGMGKDFYDTYRVVQELFEQAGDCTGLNFVKLCFAGSERTLDQPLNAYLALFVLHASMYAVMRERGIVPDIVGGWGVGAMSAHYAAGVISLPDALYVLNKYMLFFSTVTERLNYGVMRINGLERAQLEEIFDQPDLKGRVAVVVVYPDNNYVLIGTTDAIQRLKVLIAEHIVYTSDAPCCYGAHLLNISEFVRLVTAHFEKIDCHMFCTALVTQDGTLHNAGTSIVKSVFLAPMCGPIEVEKFTRPFKTCHRVIHVGGTRIHVGNIRELLPMLCSCVVPARVVVCKTVTDLKRIS